MVWSRPEVSNINNDVSLEFTHRVTPSESLMSTHVLPPSLEDQSLVPGSKPSLYHEKKVIILSSCQYSVMTGLAGSRIHIRNVSSFSPSKPKPWKHGCRDTGISTAPRTLVSRCSSRFSSYCKYKSIYFPLLRRYCCSS